MSKRRRVVLAIDCGKKSFKGKSQWNPLLRFNTKMTKGHSDPELLGPNSYNVVYKGEKCTIGDKARFGDKNEGKASPVHIMSTLVGITRLVNLDDNPQIIMMYGESVSKYADEKHKEFIKSIFEDKHTIEVNGTEYNFEIVKCHVLPEGMGHILCNLKAYQGVQYVVDWGGTTINYLEVHDGMPDLDSSQSFTLGMHNIEAEVVARLKKKGKGTFSKAKIAEYIKKGCSDSMIQEEIDCVIEEQMMRLDEELAGFGINLHERLAGEVTFIGGTTEEFSSQIKKYYNCANVLPDSLRTNVDGFYEYGRLYYLD